MKYRGINYDIGTKTLAGGMTREEFDLDIISAEIAIIKNELHCNAIRISGLSLERIVQASTIALKHGLTVLFSPSLHYENQEKTFQYIINNAIAAEKLRLVFPNLVFVVGCELSIFTGGFVKSTEVSQRMKEMFGFWSMIKNILGVKRHYNKKLNQFLLNVVNEVKIHFHGQITYASGPWEKVNWEIFDFISVDFYRASYNKSTYVQQLRNYTKSGKPLCITEFGCCTYKGADEKGPMGWAIVDWSAKKPELKSVYTRDEETQSKYLMELLNIFADEKILGAFVFTFISNSYPYNDNPKYDLDMAAYGIVKKMPGNENKYYMGLPWVPKKSFFELAGFYKVHAQD